jgi:hypothetical protein
MFMTILDSNNYYTDFIDSKELHRFFFDFEIDELKVKVHSVFSDYHKYNDLYESALAIAVDEKEIKELNKQLDDNEGILDQKLELIDEIFCLHIYRSHVVRTLSKETVEALHNLILNELGDPFTAEKSENYEGLRAKLFGWRVATSSQSYSSYPPRDDSDGTKLDRAIAKAKHLADYTLELQLSSEMTVNQVFFLFKERSFHGIHFTSKEPVAVLKGSKKTDESYLLRQFTSNMEEVAYGAAKILGLEELFVPTQMTSIQADGPEYAGCIQPFIKGDLLVDVHEEDDFIQYLSFIDGFVTSMVMGMSDAHSGNIMIDQDDVVRYFDNSRTLPHSNAVIKRPDDTLFPSYRCHLLIEESAFYSFSKEAKTLIMLKVDNAIEKLSLLEKYLQEASKKYAFPEYWLDPKLIMSAFTERLSGMKIAMEMCTNPVDLVFKVNPFFKFYVSLRLAYQYFKDEVPLFIYTPDKEDPPSEKLMSNLFYELFSKKYCDFEYLIQKCVCMKIDPLKIWWICQKESSWDKWLLDILDYVDTVLYPRDADEPVDENKNAQVLRKGKEAIFVLLQSQAKRDHKDPHLK